MDPSYRIQSNSGTVTTAATSFTATLPNGTQQGSTLLLFFASHGGTPSLPSVDPPWVPDMQNGGREYVWRRPDQPAGETSWTVSYAIAEQWAWYIEEWASMSSITQPDSASQIGILSASQNNDLATVGSTPTYCIPDVADYRAVAMYRAQGGSAAFPAGHSYSNSASSTVSPAPSWSEVAALTVGTGTTTADFMLLVAESYPGATGTIDCTLTWDITGGGAYADKSVDFIDLAYQPAPTVQFGVLTA